MQLKMENREIIKICKSIFAKEIYKAKKNWNDFNYKEYERELYYVAIKSFRKEFNKQLKKKLHKRQLSGKKED